jgi:hypothetical protein
MASGGTITFILRKDNLHIAQIYHIHNQKTTAYFSIDTENIYSIAIFTGRNRTLPAEACSPVARWVYPPKAKSSLTLQRPRFYVIKPH